MEVSPEVKVLTSVASMAALYLFVLVAEERRRLCRISRRLAANYPARWGRLPWMLRRINPIGAVEVLLGQGLRKDPEFVELCAELKGIRACYWLAGVTGAAAMFLVLVGIRYWSWVW